MQLKKLKKFKENYIFSYCGARNGKTFTAKAIYQSLLHIYNTSINSDLDKPKVLIIVDRRKTTFNIGGTTLHSTFHISFNKLNCVPLNIETLDTMSKYFNQLCILLINEISVLSAQHSSVTLTNVCVT